MEEDDIAFQFLSEFAYVFFRPRFKRIWVDSAVHGNPNVNAADLLSIFAPGIRRGNNSSPTPQTRTSTA